MHAIPQSPNLKDCKTLGEDCTCSSSIYVKDSMCFKVGFKTKVKETEEKEKKGK